MTTPRVIKRQEQPAQDPAYIKRLAEEFKKSKEGLEALTKRQDAMKKELSDYIDTNGVVDDKGHRWVEIEGMQLKRERRVSRSFNTSAAKEWAEANGFWEDVKEVVEVLSESKMLALAWEHKELAPVVQGFYEEKESWAFKV
jgi:hypothetical protein